MGGAYPWLPLRSLSWHLDNRSRDCLGSSSLPLTLVLLDLVQLHLLLMIQLSVVILETHTVWIRLISTKDGKMETSRIRQRQRLSRYFYGRGGGLASTSTTLRQTPLDTFLISSFSSWTPMSRSPPCWFWLSSAPPWYWSPPSPPCPPYSALSEIQGPLT